jgi:hypothetical protein
MVRNYRIEIEKFNDKIFELWKLNMEDLLVDREKWIDVDSGTQPTSTQSTGTQYIGTKTTSTQFTSMQKEYWEKFDRRARSMILICLENLVLLNVSGESIAKEL